MRERQGKDDYRVLSLGDWRSNGIICRSGYSERCYFGEDKPDSVPSIGRFLRLPGRSRPVSVLAAGRVVVESPRQGLGRALK